MISKILFGISDIIIHGSKRCENVGAGGLQAAVLVYGSYIQVPNLGARW